MSEVGRAYVSILPSARGFAAKLQRELGTDLARAAHQGGAEYGKGFAKEAVKDGSAVATKLQRELGSDMARAGKQGGDDYGQAFAKEAVNEAGSSEVSSKITDGLKTKLAAGGVVAGAALAGGLAEAMERGALSDKLNVQLGATPRQAKKYGKVASQLYAGAWGDSMGDVNDAVSSVVSSVGGLRNASTADIRELTTSAIGFADAFEIDVARAAQVAGQMVRTGLVKNASQAMDLLFTSMQNVPANVREDVLDAADEYGPFFESMGIAGRDAMNMLVAGAEKGMYGIDKTGDAVKEFTIRATDGSDQTQTAFKTIGVNADEMANRLLAGGDTAKGAFDKIVNGLLSIKDPQERANTAIKLFGTPMEDLSVNEIPQFLKQLANTDDKLGKVQGAAKRATDELGDNAASAVTTFKRKLENDFVGFLGEEVIPKASALYDAWKDLPGPLKTVSKYLGAIGTIGAGGAFLGAKFIGAIGTARDTLGGFGRKAKTAAGSIESIGDSATTSKSKLGRFGSFLAGGPWGLAIAGGILAIGAFAQSQADARARVQRLADSLDDQTGAITRNTARLVINKAQQDGVYENARKAGIGADLLTKALLGNDDALRTVNRQLDHVADNDRQAADTGRGLTYVYGEAGNAAKTLTGQLGNQNSELAESRRKWQEQKDATRLVNNALKDSKEQWGGTTKATRDNSKAADNNRRELLDLADQMGLNKKETRDLIKTYGDVPPKVETDAKFNRGQAERDVNTYVRSFNAALGDIDNEDVAVNLSSSAKSAIGAVAGVFSGGLSLLGGKHAKGGAIQGPGTGTSDSIVARLSNGEHVFTADDVRKAGGQQAMYAIRKMIQRGEFAKRGDLQYFRTGGAVEINTNLRQRGSTSAVQDMDRLFASIAAAAGTALSESLSERLVQALATGGGRPLGPGGSLSAGQIAVGQRFAQSQAGKPYQWAGTGNPSWDCSGFVGGVLLAALGRNPYQRIGSTASMPWPGFSPGPGTFTTGTDPGSHMAGNIGGLGIESRGGDGITLGSAITPLSSFARMDHYDRGGELRPGWTLAYNGTGQAETVRTADQERARQRPQRFVLDLGSGRVLTGVIRDEIAGHAAFQASTSRMRGRP